jgi:glycosyltransferase involved in cell wall biosynthesis
VKKVLMVAFHYPPYKGGSGVHRTLKFSKYLPTQGWEPVVLSAHPRAYPSTGPEQLAEVTDKVIVERAFALDTARHLSLAGCYLRLMALPDQWASWWWCGVLKGLKLVRKFHPSVIWSTYPIATAHLIGLTIHRLTGLPWIADFRDSMTEENYPRDPWSRQCYLWIEKRVMQRASRLVFTAASARQMYMQRYPFLPADRCLLIPNGYDEEDFIAIKFHEPYVTTGERPVRLVHAGLIYSDERNPRPFFRALSRLKSEGLIKSSNIVIDLRASGSEEAYRKLLDDLRIADIVRLLPALPYREALQDCADADALLLFQAASCNHQIPAKAYEYLRMGKPILALTPKDGDTGKLLTETGGATIIDLNDEEEIYHAIPTFLTSFRQQTYCLPTTDLVGRFSREYQAAQLSTCLSEVTL